jgi:hypothetical protein
MDSIVSPSFQMMGRYNLHHPKSRRFVRVRSREPRADLFPFGNALPPEAVAVIFSQS